MTSARRADRKRILVFSASFGGPQPEVADALCTYLRGNPSTDALVRHVDFFEQFMPSVGVLAKFAYQQTDQFFPRLTGDLAVARSQCAENPVVQELESGGYERVVAFLEEWQPDAVVSVIPVAAAVASEAASTLGFVSTAVFTDFSLHDTWLHPGTHAYFVASRDVSDALVVAGVQWGRVTVSGMPVSGDGAVGVSRSVHRKALGLADRFTCALAVPSGSPMESLGIASKAASSGIQVAVAPSATPRLARSIAALSKSSELIRPLGTDVSVPQLISVADVVVSRAGTSALYAALSLRVPLIIYNPVPGQERFNVDYLVNCGAALLARDEEDACGKLRFLSTHPERLSEMAAHAAALGKSDATRTVCERVLAFVT